MSAYAAPIKTALIVFPFLAFAISFILVIREYRKYGTFLFRRALILYSFVFYLLCAYFLVILPLPPRAEVAQYTSQILELRPFYFVSRFLQDTVLTIHDPSTFMPALRQGVVLEPVFNVLLLVPFGVYLRYYYKFSLKKVVLASFLLSFFFEVTQLSGLYFIYPRPYRLADVNDLINNTLGGIVGYTITPMLTFLFPTRDELDEVAYKKGQSVSLFRRFVAFLIDWFVISIVQIMGMLLLNLIPEYKQWFIGTTGLEERLWFFAMVFLVFMLLPKLTNGETLGKKVVRIRVVEEGREKIRFRALVIRYGYLYIVYGLISLYMTNSADLLNSNNRMLQLVSFMLFLFCSFLFVLFFINVLYVLVRKNRRLFYEKASRTYTISTIKEKKNIENQ
ncbi:VanZ family protein [Enterococcus caccae]|uniref:VanZ/RDD domain-containing protein n=1 Tax=Enterococcus caccae ATCC BAA-1240 TaxID=1158612 RepID=R3WEG7_9ENTE|nr:VanZ family protein [Enterococcus caccae]EOL45852.1 VanZ/RDD domain-containing protein [Enterococcus caccae ATCC BAA-1240]EOT61048.1 VanZ/RDD domain-containing protein [Enterococcus caccae ATCC BAA-1240]OJG27923.1 VanZ/RDD domain-containing protein [Enterococcus caccae]